MVPDIPKPRKVVFSFLKDTWGFYHAETLDLLGTSYAVDDYESKNRSKLSRSLVNSEIEKYHAGPFAPFEDSAATLVSAMHSARRGPSENAEIVEIMATEAVEVLGESLDFYGLDGNLFRNAMADIADDDGLSDTDKAHLLVLMFCAAGCTADVDYAVEETLRANRNMGARFRTGEPEPKRSHEALRLALVRIDANGGGGRYPLDPDATGTEIGRQLTGPNTISDVDMAVSKRHARIWRGDDGAWYIQGLGSTNGTILIDGASREKIVVEAPRSERAAGSLPDPVELHVGDTIVFGGTTQFWVQGA